MNLRFCYNTLEEVPEAFRGLFQVGADGKFYCQVEGMVPTVRLDEFRTNNTRLQKEAKEYRNFIGLEEGATLADSQRATHVRELLEKDAAGEVTIGKKKSKEEADKEVENRVAAMKAESDKKIKELTTENDTLKTGFEKLAIDQAVIAEATKRGALPTALDDIVARGRQVFRLVKGVATPFKGEDIIYGKDGTTPQTVGEFLDTMVTVSAPHLFEKNNGSGAEQSRQRQGAGAGIEGGNPFMQGPTFNLTRQGQLYQKDKPTYERLKAEAESKQGKK